MQVTIGDVKAAARKVWPSAAGVDVRLAEGMPAKTYRVSALGEGNRLVGQLDAPTLTDLRYQLELQAAGLQVTQQFADGGPPVADQF